MSVQQSHLYFSKNVAGSAFIQYGLKGIIPSSSFISLPPSLHAGNVLSGADSSLGLTMLCTSCLDRVQGILFDGMHFVDQGYDDM